MGSISKSGPFWTDKHQKTLAHTTTIVAGDKSLSIWEAFESGDLLFEGKSRHVCLFMARRDLETVCAYLGALRSEIVPLFMNGETTAANLQSFIADFTPRYIYSNEPIKQPGYALVGTLGVAQLYEAMDPMPADLLPNLAILQPTSGSTGDSKCVRVSYSNLNFVSAAIASYLQLDSERSLVSSLPFHYTFGLSILHSAIWSGAKLVLTQDSITSGEFWKTFTQNRVTDFSGVPFQFQALSKRGFPSAALDSLRCLTQAGGPLPASDVRWWLDYCEPKAIEFFVMYGQTEASPRISYLPPAMAREKIGSVGVPISGGRLEIANPNSEGTGEVIYFGPNVCLGYATSASELALGDSLGGRLQTGDLGRLDSEGYLFLTGRSKRFVKLAGTSVGMDSLEALIRESLKLETAVVGRDDKLVVVAQASQDLQLANQILERVNVSPNLLQIIFLEEIPRLDSGKINYQLLSSTYV